MNCPEINDALKIEYSSYHSELQQLFDPQVKATLSSPLLMHVFPEYQLLKNKVMIVGQETKGWCGTLADENKNVEKIIAEYKGFELGKTYHNSPFWRFSKKLFARLNPDNKFNGLLWTNLSKVDQKGAAVNQMVRTTNKAGYNLLIKEVEITQPDIIVFLTSYRQDETLRNTFKGLSIQNVDNIHYNYLARLRSNVLPCNTFRTYHPRFLNDSKRSKLSIDAAIEAIMGNLQ